MLRMPLVELCLQIKLLSLGHIKPFLSKVQMYLYRKYLVVVVILFTVLIAYILISGFRAAQGRSYELCYFIVIWGNFSSFDQ